MAMGVNCLGFHYILNDLHFPNYFIALAYFLMDDWQSIYASGRQDWLKVLRVISPELAQRLESERITLAHALHMIGIPTNAFRGEEMRYLSERDGKDFATAEECIAHEEEISAERLLIAEAAVYVDSLKNEEGHQRFDGRARTREINAITAWLRYDLELHPERYAPAPPVPAVREVS